MARQNNALDYRVEAAIIQVCEDLSLDIPTIAKEICDEFENSETPASRDSIRKELIEARFVQIQENHNSDPECVWY